MRLQDASLPVDLKQSGAAAREQDQRDCGDRMHCGYRNIYVPLGLEGLGNELHIRPLDQKIRPHTFQGLMTPADEAPNLILADGKYWVGSVA